MVDNYDLPLPKDAAERAKQSAAALMRRKRWRLWLMAAIVVAAGIATSIWHESFGAFARSGALLTVLSIAHAYGALRWANMVPEIERTVTDIFTQVELEKADPAIAAEDALKQAKATAHKRVQRAVSPMFDAVQREYLRDHLLVGALGTAIWGFGDLLPCVLMLLRQTF